MSGRVIIITFFSFFPSKTLLDVFIIIIRFSFIFSFFLFLFNHLLLVSSRLVLVCVRSVLSFAAGASSI